MPMNGVGADLERLPNFLISHPLAGSDYLHGLLREKVISHDHYEQLVRLAEDPDIEYEVIII